MFSWLSSYNTPSKVEKPQKTTAVTDTVKEGMLMLEPLSAEDQPFYNLFKKQHAMHWSPEELDFLQDKEDYSKLPEPLRLIFDKVLAFFASADSIILENTLLHFLKNSETLVIRMLYGEQLYFESLHIITYSASLNTYITDSTKRLQLIKSFSHDPLIAKREEWMCSHMDEHVSEAERLVAFICAEGINFVSSFLFIFYLRSTGRFPIFASANTLIARDELGIHVELGIMRFMRFYSKDISEDTIAKIVEESVNLELDFARSLITSHTVENLHLNDIEGHIKNLGNFILVRLGAKSKWDVDRSSLPPWLSFLDLRPRANFYERPVTEYQTPKAVSENPQNDIDF